MAENGGAFGGSGLSGEALLRALLDSANVMAGVVELLDDDFRYIMTNPTAAAFHGREEGGIDGLCCRDLGMSETIIAQRLAALRECHASDKPRMIEYPSRNKDGREGWYLGAYSRIPDERALISFVIVDITGQRRAQEIAEAQTMRLALALEAAELGIWEYDIKDDRVDWDQRTRTLFGVPADAAIDFATYASRVHPEDLDRVQDAYETALSGGRDGRYIVEHRTAAQEGARRWIRGAGRVIFDAKGEAVRVLGTVQDITEQVLARERQALLVDELNHRVKNNLATVQAIVSHTLRVHSGDMRQFRETFQDRLMSLARGHELLTRTHWETPHLAEVLRAALEPFDRDAIAIADGHAPVGLHPELAINLIMVLHELATNAVKYGALSATGGEVRVGWSVSDKSVSLDWRELGGPPVLRPTRQGFGTRLMDTALRRFGGSVKRDFAPDGLLCHLTLPFGDAAAIDNPHPPGANA